MGAGEGVKVPVGTGGDAPAMAISAGGNVALVRALHSHRASELLQALLVQSPLTALSAAPARRSFAAGGAAQGAAAGSQSAGSHPARSPPPDSLYEVWPPPLPKALHALQDPMSRVSPAQAAAPANAWHASINHLAAAVAPRHLPRHLTTGPERPVRRTIRRHQGRLPPPRQGAAPRRHRRARARRARFLPRRFLPRRRHARRARAAPGAGGTACHGVGGVCGGLSASGSCLRGFGPSGEQVCPSCLSPANLDASRGQPCCSQTPSSRTGAVPCLHGRYRPLQLPGGGLVC